MTIPPARWKEVEPYLAEAIDLDPEAREAWLESLRTTRPDVMPLLEKLLAAHERAERSGALETVPKLAPPPPSLRAEGDRVGPFRLVRPLGRGGMGEVWLAEQADGRVTRQVALKLPWAIEAGDVRAERFSRERDILAKLAHPNIARLYDAGADDRGQPWLAMEFVEGEPLDAHVARLGLGLAERIALFRQVLGAVGHAHRHLVVHRDLKPANILVDGAGAVKLLDFGIAKLMGEGAEEDPAARDLTRAGGRVLTPRYCAPEQAGEGAITTVTDLYSLGVILHELATGASPYGAVREGKPFRDAMVLSAEFVRPSSLATDGAARERGLANGRELARRVAGDLDAILLKAMRRNPAERYASADEFDADLGRHLGRRPVKAREGTWRYLAGRFAARNQLPLAVAGVALVMAALGVVMIERERRAAVAERERAERHFARVRAIANTMLFEVHGAIEKLPGALAARQKIVETALSYLDALSGEAARTPGLALEVATAYRKIAEIEGDALASNKGRIAEAKVHADKALALLAAIPEPEARSLPVMRERREAYSLEARMRRDAADAAAVEAYEKTVAFAKEVAAMPGADRSDRLAHVFASADLAHALAVLKSERGRALALLAEARPVLEALVEQEPKDRFARNRLANLLERESIIVELSMKPEDVAPAIALLKRSVDVSEALLKETPLDNDLRQALAKRLANLAGTETFQGDREAAIAHSERAVALSGEAFRGDPTDAGAAVVHLRSLAVSIGAHNGLGKTAPAIVRAREAMAHFDALAPAVRERLPVRANLSVVHAYYGQALMLRAEDRKLPREDRVAAAKEAVRVLTLSREFRLELVKRGIDAHSAGKIAESLKDYIARAQALSKG